MASSVEIFFVRCVRYVHSLVRPHLEEAGESYRQHLWFTVKISAQLLFTGVVLLIHGVAPFLFTRTASKRLEAIYAIMKSRIPLARRQEIDADWHI